MALNDNFKWGIPKKRVFWDKEKEILPFIFDDINTPTEEIYPVKYEGKWGLYYSRKKVFVIEPQYEDASVIREGLWAVKNVANGDSLICSTDVEFHLNMKVFQIFHMVMLML